MVFITFFTVLSIASSQPVYLYSAFDPLVQFDAQNAFWTRYVQNANQLGLKSICSRLDTTEAINRYQIWQIII